MGLATVFVLLAVCAAASAQYGGGSGSAGDPYQIHTAEQLNAIGANPGDLNKHFVLMENIDLSDYPLGTLSLIGRWVDHSSPSNRPFSGVFDGNGKSIEHFSYIGAFQSSVGLFPLLSGTVKNLKLVEPKVIVQGLFVGALVGRLEDGLVSDCYAKDVTVSGTESVGGLVGYANGGLGNCATTGGVWGASYVGGLAGQLWARTAARCYSRAQVTGTDNVGGLVGKMGGENCILRESYARGQVQGGTNVGGLVGQVERGSAFQCYSTGPVSGGTFTGGLVGQTRLFGDVLHSFWDVQSSGLATSDGGIGKTTLEMKQVMTFWTVNWVFPTTWSICEEINYPVLTWQIPPGDLKCPDGVDWIDFATFALSWRGNPCFAPLCNPNADLDASTAVNGLDLWIFCDNWLEGLD